MRDIAVREQPCDGEGGVRARVGAQAELRARPRLVRDVLFAMDVRRVGAGYRGGPPRARRRSAVRVHHDAPRVLSVLSRSPERGNRDGPSSRSTGSRVIYHALGTRCLPWNRRTIRRGGLDARSCDGDLGTPLARALQPGLGLRAVGEPTGGERAARRTGGPRLASLCPADLPCPDGRGVGATRRGDVTRPPRVGRARADLHPPRASFSGVSIAAFGSPVRGDPPRDEQADDWRSLDRCAPLRQHERGQGERGTSATVSRKRSSTCWPRCPA